jgi:hypothetical protein
MRRLRISLVGTVIFALLGGLSVAAVAQTEESATADAPTAEVLFEVTLPAEAVPERITKMNTLILTVDPGVEASISSANEAMRGRALYLDEGELIIEPMADALVWRGDEVLGGSPETVTAATPTELAAGDLIFLPAIPDAALDPDAVVRVQNPGTVPAVTLGFHTHAAGGGFSGWPDGVTGVGMAEHADPDAMELVMDGEATFRLSRVTAESGTAVPVSDDALFSLLEVLDGEVERTLTGAGGDDVRTWPAGQGGVVFRDPDVTIDLVALSDTPAVVMEVAVVPSGAGTADEAAEVPAKATTFRGTATQRFMGLESESIVDGVTQYRGVRISVVFESDDPRFSGEGMLHGNRDVHEFAGVGLDVDRGTTRIANEDGAWEGQYSAVLVDGLGGSAEWYVGSGDYEGLTAFVRYVTAIPDTDGSYEFEGWIFPGELPPLPELPAE